MYGNRKGVLKLVGQREIVFGGAIVEFDTHCLALRVYRYYPSYVSVKYSLAGFAPALPGNIVVVFCLHYLIALAEQHAADTLLALFSVLRVEPVLKHRVQRLGAELALAGWGEYLYVGKTVDSVCLWQSVAAQAE